MFTTTHDQAIQRWDTTQGEYAVAYDASPTCPAGDVYSGHNCAQRDGRSWHGDKSVLTGPHETASAKYCGSSFIAAGQDKDEAEFVVQMFAHWAEGHVYAVGFSPADGGSEETVYGVYTPDGSPPDLAEVKDILGHS